MSSINEDYWYKWYPTHFHRDTLHLNLAEDGAYRRLIDQYMLSGRPLPNDDLSLCRLLGSSMNEWRVVAPKVRAMFKERNDGLHYSAASIEFVKLWRIKFSRRPSISDTLRMSVYERAHGLCVYCGVGLDSDGFHCDHIIPFSRGGKTNLKNLAASCSFCNLSKKDRTPGEWQQ